MVTGSVIRWSSRSSALLFTMALLAFSVGLPAGGAPAPSSPAGNLDQWGNTAPTGWQNGNLNPSNSDYAESDGVPYRLMIKDLGSDATVTHTIHINYDFTKGGVYKFDTLSTYNLSDAPNISGNIPGGGYTWPGGTPATFPFPVDPYFATDTGPGDPTHDPETQLILADPNSRNLTIFGGTITAISPPVHSGLSTGDSSADLIVSFTSAGDDVALLWSGHLAKSLTGWGSGFGAASGGGAPFHMRTTNLDLGGGANQDRSMQLKFESLTSTTASSGGPVGTRLHDSAAVTSDSNPKPSGTVTFNLYAPGDTNCSQSVYNETVALSAAATASTATGFVSNAAGTWTWIASYSGDSKNAPSVGLCSDSAEKSTITAPSVGAASLTLTKMADAASVPAGSPIGYTIRVTNTGNAVANDVSITDSPLPAGPGVSWTVDPNPTNTTASGCSVTGAGGSQSLGCSGSTITAGSAIQVHIISPTDAGSCESYVNSGATAADANHTATQAVDATITETGCAASLQLTKTADAASVPAGSQIGYLIRVTNTGNAVANNLSITDSPLPAGPGVSWTVDPNPTNTTASGCSVTGAAGSQSLGCSGSTIAAGAAIQVHIISATDAGSCETYTNSGATASDNANHSASQQGTASITLSTCVLGNVFTNESQVLGETLARTGTPLQLNELTLLALTMIMCGYALGLVSKRRSMVPVTYEPKHVKPGRKLAFPRRGRRSARLLFKK